MISFFLARNTSGYFSAIFNNAQAGLEGFLTHAQAGLEGFLTPSSQLQ
jgi:hypothetical protein